MDKKPIHDDSFNNDPLFSSLREFAKVDSSEGNIPSELAAIFIGHTQMKRRRRIFLRTGLGALISIALVPSLAAAEILPSPIQRIVENVSAAIIKPIRVITQKQIEVSSETPGVQSEVSQESDSLDPSFSIATSEPTHDEVAMPSPNNSTGPSQDSETPKIKETKDTPSPMPRAENKPEKDKNDKNTSTPASTTSPSASAITTPNKLEKPEKSKSPQSENTKAPEKKLKP